MSQKSGDIFIETPFGRLHGVRCGSGDPLMLLHSVGCSVCEFEPVLELLGRTHRVLAWDMPGHGDSARLGRALDIGDYADAAIAWLEGLGEGRRIHVGGASIGGLIALEAVRRRPELFRSLALVETGLLSEAAWRARWPMVEDTFAVPTQTLESIAPRFRAVDDSLLRRWNIDRNKAGGSAMMSAMWAIRRYRFEAALGSVSIPTLLLYGDRSPVGESLPTARAALPQARAVVMEACGHFPMMDDPPGFVRELSDFLATVEEGA